MKNSSTDNRKNPVNHRHHTPNSKLLTGSLINKFPVVLDGGRTIIFISDKSKEDETRRNYELRRK